MCGICETDDTKFSCCGGCNKGGCMSMGKNNCRAATLCCYCPLRHMYYGCQHCTLCCTSPANMSSSKREKHQELEYKDKCFGNSHKYGAICCPCMIPMCFLGVSGCALTYLASFFCFVGGCACKTTTCIVSCVSTTASCCSGCSSCCASTASAGKACCCCCCCCVSSNAVTEQPRANNEEDDAKPGASGGDDEYHPEKGVVTSMDHPPPAYDDPPPKVGKNEIV